MPFVWALWPNTLSQRMARALVRKMGLIRLLGSLLERAVDSVPLL